MILLSKGASFWGQKIRQTAFGPSSLVNGRGFYGWLNSVANQVDPERIEAVGPDRAAAEWLLRCGASVKWKGIEKPVDDYNALGGGKGLEIEEIDGTNSTVMSVGFPHLKGLKQLRKIVMKRNAYLDDEALAMLPLVQESLKHLELIGCAIVTDTGVKSLAQLQNLQKLKIFDLPSVSDQDDCLNLLKSKLTQCDIEWRPTE